MKIKLLLTTISINTLITNPALATSPSPKIGIISNPSTAFRTFDDCKPNQKKQLFEGMTIAISGYFLCSQSDSTPKTMIVGYYGNEKFFINPNDVITAPGVIDSLPIFEDQDSLMEKNTEMESSGKIVKLIQINKALESYSRAKRNGIEVIDFHAYDVSEYTDATGLKIKAHNPTSKRIKYIRIEVKGLNPVGDPVRDPIKMNITQRVTGVGPIEPGETATYSFDNLWFTDLVTKPMLINMKIEYMDNSYKSIKNIKQVTIDQVHQDVVDWEYQKP